VPKKTGKMGRDSTM